jgi:hypothetical protein
MLMEGGSPRAAWDDPMEMYIVMWIYIEIQNVIVPTKIAFEALSQHFRTSSDTWVSCVSECAVSNKGEYIQ